MGYVSSVLSFFIAWNMTLTCNLVVVTCSPLAFSWLLPPCFFFFKVKKLSLPKENCVKADHELDLSQLRSFVVGGGKGLSSINFFL